MRVKNAVRNSFFSVLGQIVLILVGFVSQRVLNHRLGAELVGMNGVISNIIAILSVSELGIASAIVYNLYAALSRQDEEEIAALMNLYRKAYCIFAAVITALGLAVMPFIHLFLKDNSFSRSYILTVYLMWLLRTVLAYLLSYKRSILIADQREYVVSIGTMLVNVLNYGGIIVIVELTRNYVLALGFGTAAEAAVNLWIWAYVDRKYPFLKRLQKQPLPKNIVKKIFDNIKNIFVTRLSAKLLLSTDNLIISGLIGVVVSGLYNNYCLVTSSITNIVVSLSNAIQPTIGHMFLDKDNQKNENVLRQITFLFFLIASVAAAGFCSVITPFVRDFWLGAEYEMGLGVVIICTVNCCFSTLCQPIGMMMSVTGLFQKERNISVIVALVNLVLSLALVRPLGVVGVVIGTVASYFVQLVYRIRVFFGIYLKRSAKAYCLDLLQYIVLAAVETVLVYLISVHVYAPRSLLCFLLLIVLAVVVPLAVSMLVFFRSWRFRSVLDMIRLTLRKGEGH